MLEGLAIWILRTYVGEYVENLNTEQLSIGYGKIWPFCYFVSFLLRKLDLLINWVRLDSRLVYSLDKLLQIRFSVYDNAAIVFWDFTAQ